MHGGVGSTRVGNVEEHASQELEGVPPALYTLGQPAGRHHGHSVCTRDVDGMSIQAHDIGRTAVPEEGYTALYRVLQCSSTLHDEFGHAPYHHCNASFLRRQQGRRRRGTVVAVEEAYASYE